MAKWTLPEKDPVRSIYLLTRTARALNYDVVRSMVVRAFDEQEARKLASEKAMEYLQKLGVKVHLNCAVKSYDGHEVVFNTNESFN